MEQTKEDLVQEDVKSEIASVSLQARIPQFWRENPRLWFAQFEAVIAAHKIGDEHKYNLVIPALDRTDIEQISDIIIKPPTSGKYAALKSRLISVYQESEHRQIQKLLGGLELGEQRPSQLLRRMRDLGGNTFSDETLKVIWMNQIPAQIRAVLSVNTESSLDGLAAMADKMMEHSEHASIAAVTAAMPGSNSNTIAATQHSAVDVVSESKRDHDINKRWQQTDGDRLSTLTCDRSTLLRSHAAKSAECSQGSPRARRLPRESRRISLAQAAGYVQLNQYRLLEPIGQGSYGIVKLAYNEEDDTHYAMKILSKRKLMRRAGLFGRAPPRRPGPGPPPDPLQRVYREIAVLKKLDHPNVVKLVEVLDDPAEDQLYLVFQLLEGGPVIDVPTDNPLSEEVARRYFRDTVLGVEYLHYQRIAHRDIKPANLLLGEGRVQLADLGACGELAEAGRLSGAVGTPAFRAPEAHAPTERYSGEAADIWSLGVTLFAMVTGRVPWSGPTANELQRRVLSEPLTFPPRPPLSRPLKRLLARMLDKDPATRATLQEIKDHEWVTAGGKEPLPSEQENCRLVEVTDEDMERVVTSIPNLSTLILIKTMLKKHSFQNPFLRSREGSARRESGDAGTGDVGEGEKGLRRAALSRSGRSLSAPGNYLTESKQPSFDIALESVEETKERAPETKENGKQNQQYSRQNSLQKHNAQQTKQIPQIKQNLQGKQNSQEKLQNLTCKQNSQERTVNSQDKQKSQERTQNLQDKQNIHEKIKSLQSKQNSQERTLNLQVTRNTQEKVQNLQGKLNSQQNNQNSQQRNQNSLEDNQNSQKNGQEKESNR